MQEILFLLLPLAFLSGWQSARKRYKKPPTPPDEIPQNFVRGVNYLLNEQPDKALDIFLNYPDIDENTADTFLALGNLFRSRGEVNRALRVHQYLVSRADLGQGQRLAAMTALGEDFFAAGLLDRAESVFSEILRTQPHYEPACMALRLIYEKLQEWEKAREMASCATHNPEQQAQWIAHYLCEQAQVLLKERHLFKVEEKLQQATQLNEHSARVKVLWGDLAVERHQKDQALEYYQAAVQQEPRLLEMLSERLLTIYSSPFEREVLYQFALNTYQQTQDPQLLAPLIKIAQQAEQSDAISALVLQALEKTKPTTRAMVRASQLLAQKEQQISPSITYTATLAGAIQRLATLAPEFKCESCGYKMHDFLWRCPACHQWDTVKND